MARTGMSVETAVDYCPPRTAGEGDVRMPVSGYRVSLRAAEMSQNRLW